MLLSARNGFACVLRSQGALQQAEEEWRLSLELRQQVNGPQHRATMVIQLNLALLLQEQKKLKEAEDLLRSPLALQTSTAKLGKDHPDTIFTMFRAMQPDKRSPYIVSRMYLTSW